MKNSPSIGIDIVSIPRIENLYNKYGDRFINRIFTKNEQIYCEKQARKYHSYAARFAAKEALIKTIGKGIFAHKDIEVIIDEEGSPSINIVNSQYLKEFKDKALLLSVSHDKDYAIASVLMI